MAETFSKGDKVRWTSHGGEAHGKAVGKQTAPTRIKGHKVAASAGDPQYIVETDAGKRAAHKPEALKKGLRPAPSRRQRRSSIQSHMGW